MAAWGTWVKTALLTAGLSSVGSGAAQPATERSAAEVSSSTWVAVAWHDVRDQVPRDIDADLYAVGTRDLAEQFDWLALNGWTPVSLEQLVAAREGRAALPPRPVLLTFDDGLKSVYTRVFPLLQAYAYPAVVAVQTGWLEAVAGGGTVDYEGTSRGAEAFASWAELREMLDSGLVEIASHTHDLHRGVRGNPQGNQQPAATTLQYLDAQGRYETVQERAERLRADLSRSVDTLERRLGVRPRAVVWPFGEYDAVAETVAAELGMHVSFGLASGRNGFASLQGLHRLSITANPDLERFAINLPQASARSLVRAVHVVLDDVHDNDPASQARKLDVLVERVLALGITKVYLQAHARADAAGRIAALYFPNRHLPVGADLFNRVAWQLRTRANVEVYAVLPQRGFALAPGVDGPQVIAEIYEDLARHAHVAGLLFRDAGAAPGVDGGSDCPAPVAVDLSPALAERARRYRQALRTAYELCVNRYAGAGEGLTGREALAGLLASHDYVVLRPLDLDRPGSRPTPNRSGEESAETWLADELVALAGLPGGLERIVFELPPPVPHAGTAQEYRALRRQMLNWIRAGALNLAYHPGDLLEEPPAREALFQGLSSRSFPYREVR